MTRSVPALARASIFAFAGLLCSATAWGQIPATQLTAVFPPGGKAGAALDVNMSGTELGEVHALSFSHPGISAVQKTAAAGRFDKAPKPLPGQFTVTISASVPRGLYEVRAVGKFGASNPRTFVVGALNEVDGRQAASTAKDAKEVPAESVVNGQINPERSDFFRFAAKKGQRVLIECWARRIDSRMDPAITLLDAAGHELARAKERDHHDPLLDYFVPADGSYIVKLYDFLYKGGPEYYYRLSISTAPRIDFVMPPAGMAGTKGKYTFYGRNLPGGMPSDFKTPDGKPLDRLEQEVELPSEPEAQQQLPPSTLIEPSESFLDAFPYRLQTPAGESNPVQIFFATAPITPEQEPNDKPAQAQKINPPCEVAGQFYPRGDQDWYTFDAKKGEVWWIEVYSQRMGLPTDPYMLIQRVRHNDKGADQVNDVLEVDDPKPEGRHERKETDFLNLGNDPSARFEVPEDGTYRILVRDLYFRGNPRFVYRLAIRRDAPDFRLVAIGEAPVNPENGNRVILWSPLLRTGETMGVPVMAMRRDSFNGGIHIAAEGLPDGVTSPGVTIGPGADVGVLTFTASDKAAAWSGPVKIVGHGQIAGADVAREARCASVVLPSENVEQISPRFRLSSQLVLTVEAVPAVAPIVEIGTAKTLETSLGGKLEIPIKITRRGNYKGKIKLIPAGLPRELRMQEQDVPPGSDTAKLTLDVQSTLPPGEYSFSFRVGARVNYRHNPEGASAAADAAKQMERIAAECSEANRKAQEAKANADRAAGDAVVAAKQAGDAIAPAQKAVADADAKHNMTVAAKTAAQKVADEAAAKLAEATKAKDALDTAPEEKDADKAKKFAADKQAAADAVGHGTDKNQQAQAALAAATKAEADAAAALSTATTAKNNADKSLADANARVKTTADVRTAAEAAANAAADQSRAAESEKQAAADRARQAADVSQPREINIAYYCTPVLLKIAPAPITFGSIDPAAGKPGAKVEIPITINRLFNFGGEVYLGWNAQGSDPALHINDITIPAGQNAGKLVVDLDQNAKPGDHRFTLRARMQLNGQQLTLDQPITLKVEPADPPAKK